MSKKYKAIFFDWDGTAVMSRQAPVEEAVAAMKPLLASGVKLVIVSGTTYDKIASGKIHEHFTPEEASNLYLGLGRGAYNYKMVNGQPEIFADCIGFNEPGESFEKTTHCVQLTQSTIDANQRLFDEGEAVPEKAFTMGIKSIMQSKHILLIANGEKKAQIIRDAFFGPVTPKVPASILQLHNNVTVIVDKEAGKLIKDVL